MFETIADQTNDYARKRISSITHDRDPTQQLDDPTNKKHNNLHSWKDVNVADIKLIMAHVTVMALVCKSAIHGYWSKNTLSHMPFFGKYLSRNKFQTILLHLHFNDVSSNPAPGLPGHDPLAHLRNIIAMAQYSFKHVYIPSADVTIGESTCTFQGRVKFLQYQKSKPTNSISNFSWYQNNKLDICWHFQYTLDQSPMNLYKEMQQRILHAPLQQKLLWAFLTPETS